MSHEVAVIGGGITGLAAAHALLSSPDAPRVTVFEAQQRLGGKIHTTPFAGLPAIDEGADAFLARVPWATDLARAVGLEHRLTSPAAGSAAVWWGGGLRPIPDGLLLGVPTSVGALARSRLISWRGKLRAATEPFRRRTDVSDDSIGSFVRARFGDEVHERLVDPLIGSIYAADTDRFSLTAVPQLADLANTTRSVLVGGRRLRQHGPLDGPVFYALLGGVGDLVAATAAAVEHLGGEIRLDTPCTVLERAGARWMVEGTDVDAVVLACPAAQTGRLLGQRAYDAIGYADVVVITVAIPSAEWPSGLAGLSGYLVPKPVQGLVTAVSFGSQKWAHWRRDGSILLRISLGRDGLPVMHLDDDQLLDAALTEVGTHVGIDLRPTEVRVSRWHRAFPQYRPHHHRLVGELEHSLPAGLALAGASYHGIGIPACVRSGQRAAGLIAAALAGTRQ